MYVQVNNLSFQYRNASKETIENFNLEIMKGEVVSILGQSGSGKSTVLRLLAGLEVPKTGQIIINSQTMCDSRVFMQPEKRGVGLVFQDYALFPHMNVEENVKFGLKKMTRKQKYARIDEVLELVGLTEYGKRYPYELSGGQQQRVALARALATSPSLLMFDEPFSNLDTDLQHRIRDELRVILKTTGITSIFVTHDQTDAKKLADRVIVMEKGKIIRVGKPEELLTRAVSLG